MINYEYRFKFYLNARHEMEIENRTNNAHPHTWEFNLFLKKNCEEFIQFSEIEKELKIFLSKYEDSLLNEIPPFDVIEPSLENIGQVLYEEIKEILVAHKWSLLRLEISENPSRTYIIYESEENFFESNFNSYLINKKRFEACLITEKKSIPLQSYKEESYTNQSVTEHKGIGTELRSSTDDLIPLKCNIQNIETSQNDIKIESAAASEINYTSRKSRFQKTTSKKNWRSVFRNTLFVLIASILTIIYITKRGLYPWGSDTWGHIFKAHLLYEEFIKGNIYPIYTELWYNGIQPFRYWAPLPYYILMLFELITKGDSILSYNFFIVFNFIMGAMGWVLWGKKTGRNKLALTIALLWFFMPDNLRVLFSEGNIPRVIVTNIFPFLLYFIMDYVDYRKKISFLMITVCMFLITLSHAMIAAMVAICITIYILLFGLLEKKMKTSSEAVLAVIIGITLTGFWLYPALKGGLVSMDSEAVSEVMRSLTYPLSISLNPYMRFKNLEIYYYGLSVFLICIIGFIIGGKKSRAGFCVAIMVLAGTTTALLFLFKKIPMSQLFWMVRFTPLAYGVFFVSLLYWNKPRKITMLAAILFLIFDCLISIKVLCYDFYYPVDLANSIEPSVKMASQRVAILDSSKFGSFPTYYLSNNNEKEIPQVYGWAWQGASTAENIVQVNTALENGWYAFMFDRCLELGADSLVIMKEQIKDKEALFFNAKDAGYIKVDENTKTYIFKYPVETQFGTRVSYKGLGIGRYASNLSYIFPEIELGNSEYLDSYSIEDLAKYKVLFLSGFKYKNRENAEELVKSVSEIGTRIIIDMSGTQSDISSSRAEFLGVRAQPVLIKDRFPSLEYGSNSLGISTIPKEYKEWHTMYLENLDDINGQVVFDNQYMSFLGNKYNKNINFIGLNLPFFSLITKDKYVISILEDILGLKAEKKPYRDIVEVKVKREGNIIKVHTAKENTILSLAYLDAFQVKEGRVKSLHNLLKLEDKSIEIKIKTPYVKEGIAISIIGAISQIYLLLILNRGLKLKTNIEEVNRKGFL